jgi:hypothetical protein
MLGAHCEAEILFIYLPAMLGVYCRLMPAHTRNLLLSLFLLVFCAFAATGQDQTPPSPSAQSQWALRAKEKDQKTAKGKDTQTPPSPIEVSEDMSQLDTVEKYPDCVPNAQSGYKGGNCKIDI